MKYWTIILIVIIMVSCQSKERDMAIEILTNNNKSLEEDIESLKVQIDDDCLEYPELYDTIIQSKLKIIFKKACSLRNRSDYNLVFQDLKGLVVKAYPILVKNAYIKFKPADAENAEILKNDLLVNIKKIYLIQISRVISSCRMPFIPKYIRANEDKDSINLSFVAPNPYMVVTDSIVNEQNKAIHYNYKSDIIIGRIKYKKPTERVKFYGKLFYRTSKLEQPAFITNLDTEIKNSKNK